MKILKLTIKKKWFDMIASGEKTEEYRTPGKWIGCRLDGRSYDAVQFRNGYSRTSPVVTLEYLGWKCDHGRPEWGAPARPVIVIKLGKILT
jgi:hypothetical protein